MPWVIPYISSYSGEIEGVPRSAYRLVAESATGKVLTQHILYRALGWCR